MQPTPNNNIKIVRLQSGEDIIADTIMDEENDTVLLDNPMHVIFKRVPTGQTVMMMAPWLPLEIIKENNAVIYASDILTIIDPKEEVVEYYGNVVVEAQHRMENSHRLGSLDDEEEDDEDESELNEEELFELMRERRKGNIH